MTANARLIANMRSASGSNRKSSLFDEGLTGSSDCVVPLALTRSYFVQAGPADERCNWEGMAAYHQ